MIEKIAHGGKLYKTWLAILAVLIIVGVCAYANQYIHGLELTGMSRDTNWGLYIAQFTFFVGVAASGVMIAIPLNLANYKEYSKIAIFGEFMAVAAVMVALLMIIVDLGYPTRVLNVILHPSPHSMMFWDMCVLSSYFLINIIIGWASISAEHKGVKPGKWVHVLTYISIPLAISIHTVTAYLYCGNPGRDYWLSAIVAGRFLSSAFAAGPSLLLLICFVMKKFTTFDISKKAVNALALTICYAFIINVFFMLCEIFTACYSNIPEHIAPLNYLFWGVSNLNQLSPFMWAATILAVISIVLLVVPRFRHNKKVLTVALVTTFLACWLDKGVGFTLGGFSPNAFGQYVPYYPTVNEICIIIGVFSIGLLVLTFLYKIVIGVRAEQDQYLTVAGESDNLETA